MEERELRITYGMCFKLAGDVITKLLEADVQHDPDDIVADIEDLAARLAEAALAGQEALVSENQHRVTVTRSAKPSGFSKKQGSSGKSSSVKPKNPSAPASEAQVKLASKLFWTKDHNLAGVDPSSFDEMTMGEIGPIIEQLIAADDA